MQGEGRVNMNTLRIVLRIALRIVLLVMGMVLTVSCGCGLGGRDLGGRDVKLASPDLDVDTRIRASADPTVESQGGNAVSQQGAINYYYAGAGVGSLLLWLVTILLRERHAEKMENERLRIISELSVHLVEHQHHKGAGPA